MSIALYDEALIAKIKNWIIKKDVTILYPDQTTRLFSYIADQNKDKITLPLIAISRDRNIDLILKNKRYGESDGYTFSASKNKAGKLRYIPINLRYTIDIYTRYREEADDYFRDFIFNLIDYPTLKIEIPYNNSKIIQSFFIQLESTAQDNSDIPERLIPGQFTRITLGITLPDAKLFAYDVQDIPKITAVDIKSNLANTNKTSANISVKIGEVSGHFIDDNCDTSSSFDIDNKEEN